MQFACREEFDDRQLKAWDAEETYRRPGTEFKARLGLISNATPREEIDIDLGHRHLADHQARETDCGFTENRRPKTFGQERVRIEMMLRFTSAC